MEQVDAVVVGSGFGGSVAAYRLAEAGQSVVLLERGQPYPPGSFPRSPAEMGRAFWDPAANLYGMYDVWSFKGCDSVVSSGLGGGSLIYANVLLRKDERWFVHEELPGGGHSYWPITREDLDPHYDAVEKMIDPTPYPLDRAPYDDTPKAHAMQDAAAELGLDYSLPPLAIAFAPERGAAPGLSLPIVDAGYGNVHGVRRRTCKLCGECYIGCNDGSKNSLDHTYLSAAAHQGADLRTLHDVHAIRPLHGGGYEVDYVRHEPGVKIKKPYIHTIACKRLVLAAGTYGTTHLLLKSRKHFPGLSDALGTRFCGNGDLLTFLLKAKDRNRVRPLDGSRGPTITSAIRLADSLDGSGDGRGAYIQDGGYPGFVDWMIPALDMSEQIERAVKFLWGQFTNFFKDAPDTNMSAEVAELIGDGALSVSSLPLLGMGRDTADGVLSLNRGGRLSAEWSTKSSVDLFDRMRRTMQGLADVLGADYADNPMWFRKRIITVHPLGGSPMGHHPGEGVCDAFGEVFGFPGLYIADGAAMPGPVGPNPSLTIAAMADRMSTRLLESADRGTGGSSTGAGPVGGTGSQDEPVSDTTYGRWTGDDEAMENTMVSQSGRTSLSFTEEMKGFVTYGATDPRAGELSDKRERLSFRLTITAEDVDRFLAEPEHTARAEGWIESHGRGERRPVQDGRFNLFAPTGQDERRLMKYRLFYMDGEGRPRTLVGEKNVLHGPPTRIWPDTSTLYVHIMEGHVPDQDDPNAKVLAAGVLHIQLTDFARQLTTFRTTGPSGAAALVAFGRFFAGELWEVYGPDLG
ncbi:GMC oxidoreductase [Spirillospora sp. CA-294931]|uniref:GMC oxidoreductase n=1 Tax=Spirillospora sp. CA-294931 TaxID=3240042 RepID=UPI003D9191A4